MVRMTNPRGYSAGTRAALAQLSHGDCYNPECARRIITFMDGEPDVHYEIAHIRDAEPGNRFEATMTDDERRAFANLLLLCKPCHTPVDKTHPADYSVERLQDWKRQREGAEAQPVPLCAWWTTRRWPSSWPSRPAPPSGTLR